MQHEHRLALHIRLFRLCQRPFVYGHAADGDGEPELLPVVLRDGDKLALAQTGGMLDDLLHAASGAVCEEATEGRTSGNHQVCAVDELGDDGRGRGEDGEEVGAFPESVYCNTAMSEKKRSS